MLAADINFFTNCFESSWMLFALQSLLEWVNLAGLLLAQPQLFATSDQQGHLVHGEQALGQAGKLMCPWNTRHLLHLCAHDPAMSEKLVHACTSICRRSIRHLEGA